ncbi:hypothetical protein DES53_10759 [Roseimicrobium gellanilyticum]|uniref:CHRD domain-containing protein n=1 Tax=Roseimicrobium gellanilyticum TaxID=748857 RepID=A0A366HFE8_9BACT|nr:hypothetical protein [Roseimicrobium gellanilyticum]RBP41228.1 hypothetical protein DES53_10759 [Roseimicrobium gellanilyticum]
MKHLLTSLCLAAIAFFIQPSSSAAADIPVEIQMAPDSDAVTRLMAKGIAVLINSSGRYSLSTTTDQCRFLLKFNTVSSGNVTAVAAVLTVAPAGSSAGVYLRGTVGFVDEETLTAGIGRRAGVVGEIYHSLLQANNAHEKLTIIRNAHDEYRQDHNSIHAGVMEANEKYPLR